MAAPNTFGIPEPDPDRIDPPGGYAQMPPSAPDPVEGSTAPMTGDIPPMSTPLTLHRFDPLNYREGAGIGDGSEVTGYRVEGGGGLAGHIDQASTMDVVNLM